HHYSLFTIHYSLLCAVSVSLCLCGFTFVPGASFVFAQRQAAQPQGDLSPAARQALEQTIALLQQNNLTEAEKTARLAVTSATRSAVTHNLLGVVLNQANRRTEAVAEFNAAIRLDANFVSARNNLGRLLAEQGKTQEAIAEFEHVLKIDANHAQANYN